MRRPRCLSALAVGLVAVGAALGWTACGVAPVHSSTPPAATGPSGPAPRSPGSATPPGSSAPAGSPGSSAATARPGTGPTPAAPTSAVVVEPDAGRGPVYDLMRGAQRSLDMTMYELVDPTAEEILAADAGRGVDVRVLLDGRLEKRSNTPAYSYLAAHRVHVAWAPTRFPATHQKTVTVDGRESAVMTLNLTSRYYANTRDFAVLDRNPADVAAIEAVFNCDFAQRPLPPEILPAGADLVWSPGSEAPLVRLIDSARRQVDFESEELDDPAVVAALAGAARRGVAVDVVMTDDPSWHPAFATITAAGGHVRLDHGEHPIYIHAKAILVDGSTAFVGSENATPASLDRNRELGLIVADPAVVAPVERTIAADFAAATPDS
jgi:phosphatidylserine/phosphatidylglycerophosphate/cardiolipin synthase-like enzyme